MTQKRGAPPRKVPLNRALSKLGILSRRQATQAIEDGRVSVDGRLIRDPSALVEPERMHVLLDGVPRRRGSWRALILFKPRGVVTTRRDPEGRRTVYDVLGDVGRGLVTVGRLDWATTGLLLLTSDTRLADWIADPAHAVPRVYVVTVRGRVTDDELSRLTAAGGDLRAHDAVLRKVSTRESHLIVELREGRNREVRRLFARIGHEVTKLKRVRVGGLELGKLEPGQWRQVSADEVRGAFPRAPINDGAA